MRTMIRAVVGAAAVLGARAQTGPGPGHTYGSCGTQLMLDPISGGGSPTLVTFDLSTITALEPESRWGGVSRRFGERLASGRIDPPSSSTPRGSPPPRQQTGLADQLHALSYALKHPEQR